MSIEIHGEGLVKTVDHVSGELENSRRQGTSPIGGKHLASREYLPIRPEPEGQFEKEICMTGFKEVRGRMRWSSNVKQEDILRERRLEAIYGKPPVPQVDKYLPIWGERCPLKGLSSAEKRPSPSARRAYIREPSRKILLDASFK